MTETQAMGFKYVYAIQLVDHRDTRIVGIFEAAGLAEMARLELDSRLTEDERDTGIYYGITTFEIGKIYR